MSKKGRGEPSSKCKDPGAQESRGDWRKGREKENAGGKGIAETRSARKRRHANREAE